MDLNPAIDQQPTADQPSAEASPLSYTVFAVHQRQVTWEDVLATTDFLGQLQPLIDSVRAGQAAVEAVSRGDLTLDPEAAQDVANQLRYHHNLITGEETAAWLEDRHLSLIDLNHFVASTLLRDDATPPATDEQSPAELAHLLWCEANLRDLWPQLLPPVARRIIVEELRLNEQTFDPSFSETVEATYKHHHQLSDQSPHDHAASRPFIAPHRDDLFRREASYQQYCALIASPEHCRRRLAALRTDFYQVDYELAAFELRDVACEAYLCASVDGESLPEICERAPGAYERQTAIIEDLPDDLRPYLVSARAGEIIRPVAAAEGGYYLLRLHQKQEPDQDSPAIRRRVRSRLLDEAFAPYLEQQLEWPRWQFPLQS